MPRKRPNVLTNQDKPIVINDDKVELYRKITPKTLMNQYYKIPKPIQENTVVNNLTDSITRPTFSYPANSIDFEDLRNRAKSLLGEPVVNQSLLQSRFQNKKFPNGMKAMCYSCGKDIYFMDDFFIHAGTVHGTMLYEAVETFLKLLDKIETKEQGKI